MNPSDLPIPSSVYVSLNGNVCPICGTENVTIMDPEHEEYEILYVGVCAECGASWEEARRISSEEVTGYVNLSFGKSLAVRILSHLREKYPNGKWGNPEDTNVHIAQTGAYLVTNLKNNHTVTVSAADFPL